MRNSRRWWLMCVTLVLAGSAAGLALRFAFDGVGRGMTLASDLDASDPRYREVMCGPVSLSMALGRLGIYRSAANLAAECRVSSRGVALTDLERCANRAGSVKARSRRLKWGDLVRLEGVAVLFVDGNHYLAADPRESSPDSSTAAGIRIYEEDQPSRWLPREELEARWDGTALVITKAAAVKSGEGPRIEWDTCLIDLGVFKKRHVEYQFTLSNAGDRELSINDVKLSCGCADYTLSRERLEPGESAILEARVDLSGKEGYMHQYALVQTNDPINPLSVLRMTGGVPRTRVVSCDAIRLEDLPQGGTVAQEFYVADPGFLGCQIREVRFAAQSSETDEHLTCSADFALIGADVPPLSIPAGFRTRRDYRVRLSFAAGPSCPTGPFHGEVTVTVEAGGNTTTHRVGVFGAIVDDVRPFPRVALITLGPDADSVGSATIQLRSHAKREIQVVRTWSEESSSLKIRPDDEHPPVGTSSYIITAQMPEIAAGTAPFKGSVSFELDNGSVISVPVSVFRPPG